MKSTFFKIFIGLLVVLIFFFFDACSHHSPGNRLSNHQIVKTGKQLGMKYDMKISFLGGGETKDRKIRLITVGFTRNGKPLTIEEGRKIIVDCTETFLTDINNNDKLRPFLSVYPFTVEKLNVTIMNEDDKGNFIAEPFLATISQLEGKVYYRTQDPENEYKFKSKISESYDEAVAILKKEKENSKSN